MLTGAGVSYGVSVSSDAPYLRRARALGIAVEPRTSGGTGFLHQDGDLVWAVVRRRADPAVGRDFARAYARLGAGVLATLRGLGVPADWAPAPGLCEDYCPLSSRGQVLASDGQVLGGAAQHATSTALLHHGGIAWTVDRALVERLFDLPVGGAAARLGSLQGHLPHAQPEDVAVALESALWDGLLATEPRTVRRPDPA